MADNPTLIAEEKRNSADTTPQERREINHRIANSLQIVSAFLRLKRDYKKESAEEILEKAANRISAIAHFHGHMARQDVQDVLNLTELLEDAIGDICTSMGLRCVFAGDDVKARTNKALSVLIIVNELAVNSHKHGYGGVEGGAFLVECRKTDGNALLLTVSDKGRGLPANFSIDHTRGLGMKLITSTVEQIMARLNLKTCGRDAPS